jgi:hypothetical protein
MTSKSANPRGGPTTKLAKPASVPDIYFSYPSRSDEPFSGFVTSFMTASALVMRQQRVVRLAVFVHTAGVAVAGSLRLVPHAVALAGICRPMLVASTADLVELGRQATMDIRPRKLAA